MYQEVNQPKYHPASSVPETAKTTFDLGEDSNSVISGENRHILR